MEKETDRAVLIKYLLGDLSEKKELEVAERYFEDDDLFEELLDVEDELLDKYARRKLTTKEQAGFKEYLDRLPDGRQKLEFAKFLMRVIADQKPQRGLHDRTPQVAKCHREESQ